MTTWERLGAAFGRWLASAIEAVELGPNVRAAYASRYGICRVCKDSLGGPSPEQICERCHAGEVCAAAFGGGPKADA